MQNGWDIRHVDICRELSAIEAGPGARGVFAVFWANGLAIGQHVFRADQLPVSAARLKEIIADAVTPSIGDRLFETGFRARLPGRRVAVPGVTDIDAILLVEQPLAHLRRTRTYDGPHRSISVVICTRNRPDDLACCLESLEKLTRPPEEVIVVDNAPSDRQTRAVVARFRFARYVLEPSPGLSRARNAGLRAATGDIVAFTDDDVTVHPDWTLHLERAFDDAQVSAVTGLVLPAELETDAQYAFEMGNSGFGWGFQRLRFDQAYFRSLRWKGVPVWHIGAGASMAFRRTVFDRLGAFDERLGAGASGCSEDSELWYRVLAEGGTCLYYPDAVVYHRHRADVADLRSQMYQYLRGHVSALFAQYERYGHAGNLLRAFGILPVYFARSFLRQAAWKDHPEAITLRSQARGYLAGLRYFRPRSLNRLRHASNPT